MSRRRHLVCRKSNVLGLDAGLGLFSEGVMGRHEIGCIVH